MTDRLLDLMRLVRDDPLLFHGLLWLATGFGAIIYILPEVVLASIVLLVPERSPYVATLVIVLAGPVGFSIHYAAGRGILGFSGRLRSAVDRLDPDRFRRSTFVAVFLSSAASLPPFAPSSVLCGMLRLPYGRFFAAALSGRVVRFGLLLSVLLLADSAGGPFGEWLRSVRAAVTGP